MERKERVSSYLIHWRAALISHDLEPDRTWECWAISVLWYHPNITCSESWHFSGINNWCVKKNRIHSLGIIRTFPATLNIAMYTFVWIISYGHVVLLTKSCQLSNLESFLQAYYLPCSGKGLPSQGILPFFIIALADYSVN